MFIRYLFCQNTIFRIDRIGRINLFLVLIYVENINVAIFQNHVIPLILLIVF